MDSYEEKRLQHLMDNASEGFQSAAQQRSDKSSELAKQHTEYFEKLAFGSGAVLTAIVSFVGSKRDLHPSWLLRATITALAFSIVLVLIRNALYPFYVRALYQKMALKAEIGRDAAKAAYFARFPVNNIHTGQLIDASEYIASYKENQELVDIELQKLELSENRSIKWCRYLEWACLLSTGFAAGFLVFLVWKNF